MLLLEPTPVNTVWRERLALLFQVAGLALTGWVLWGARLLPRWSEISVQGLILRASIFTLLAWGAGAAITLVLYLGAMQWEREDVIRATLRTSSAAVWFAPSVILLTQLSPAAIAAAAVLVIHATRLLYHEWRAQHPAAQAANVPAGLFASVQLPPPDFWRDSAPGLAASLTVQTGVVAVLLRRPLLAGFAFAMSLAIATIFAMTARAVEQRPPQSLPRAALGVLLTLVLAIGLTVAGILPRWMHGDGSGSGFGFGDADTSTAAAKPAGPSKGTEQATRFAPKPVDAALAEGGFPGVILWPEVKPYVTLIAPMPQRGDGLATVEARPMSIPFSGEYWMFRWPYAQPPKSSFFERGSPDALSFRSTDHGPIQMEAHHKLDQAIALDCCRAIQLAIRNADRYPNTIALELVLIDRDGPGAPSLSLGREIVASLPDLGKEPVVPVREMLEFSIPATAPIAAFDEFKIVFYRDRRRMDQSAKVAIDRFLLLPHP